MFSRDTTCTVGVSTLPEVYTPQAYKPDLAFRLVTPHQRSNSFPKESENNNHTPIKTGIDAENTKPAW